MGESDTPKQELDEVSLPSVIKDEDGIAPPAFEVQYQNSSRLANLRGSDLAEQKLSAKQQRSNSHAGAQISYMETTNISTTRVLAVCFLVVISVASLFVVCSPTESEHVEVAAAKSREELVAMENSDGTWATTYKNADEQSKQGLELLFRCHIIPNVEFANSKVSQDHICECVWIANHMLRDRPLEEWLQVWPEARRTFEESVTACFEARTDVRSSFYDSGRHESPRNLQANTDDGQADPVPGSSGSTGRGKSPADGKPDLPFLKTPADRKSLMNRCREIMAASDAKRKPWSSKAPSVAGSSQGQFSNEPSKPSSSTTKQP